MNTEKTPAAQNEAPQAVAAGVVSTLISSPFLNSVVRARGEIKQHPGNSSLAHLDSALGVRLNIGRNPGGPIGAQNPRPAPLVGRYPRYTGRSPWLDPSKSNLFKDEFQISRENLPYEQFKPLEIYSWIERHGGESLFFRGLARYAPMFPLLAYHGQVALWISPPPSGHGNAIFMVMGHDMTGALRLVGGNFFTEPKPFKGSPVTSADFFAQYDCGNERAQQSLVRGTVMASISPEDIDLLRSVSRECEHFHTMAIYLAVLTKEGCLFHAAKAVIEGNKPADFSYEHFGEIK